VADWHWKVGFTSQTIRHGPRSWHFSSSVVLSSSEPGLLLGAQPRKCPLRGPYSIHILKVPSFGASVDHLWESSLFVEGKSSSKSLLDFFRCKFRKNEEGIRIARVRQGDAAVQAPDTSASKVVPSPHSLRTKSTLVAGGAKP